MNDQEIDIFRVLDFIRDSAKRYAQAKANRVHIEEFRKSKKAMLMREAESTQPEKYKSAASQETYAYSHPEYIELLEGLKAAVEAEEGYRFLLEGARLKAEVWRSLNATARIESKVF